MGIFSREPLPPLKLKEKKEKLSNPNRPPKEVTDEDLKSVEDDFDFAKIEDLQLALFAKYYILLGGNGTRAYKKLRNGNISNEVASVGANRYLRKLRQHPDFWDMLGLGYSNLKEVVDKLIKDKPEKAIDIIMKVNKEDTERAEGNITVTIANELSRDNK